MATTPEPRPALTKAPDGGLHPAAPKAAPSKHLHAAPHAPAVPAPEPTGPSPAPVKFKHGDLRARKAASAGKGAKAGKADELVDLGVKVPKKLRKAVRRKAEAEGWPPDDAVTHVLRSWVES